MYRSLIASLGFLVLAAAAPASAADLPRGPVPYRAPSYFGANNWTGFYLGFNAGGGWGESTWNGFGVSNKPAGPLLGATAGYNYQIPGGYWVFGFEGDIAWSGVDDSVACAASTCKTTNQWFGTARGRIGQSFDRVMLYVTGGAAFGDINADRIGFSGNFGANVGWTVGAGIEGAINRNWSAKIEYLYSDLGDIACSAGECGTATNVDLQMHMLRGGINYRF